MRMKKRTTIIIAITSFSWTIFAVLRARTVCDSDEGGGGDGGVSREGG